MRTLLLLAAAALAACGDGAAAAPPPSSLPPRAASPCPDKRPTGASDAPKDADALAGSRVENVCVVGGGERARADVARVVGTKAGAPLDAKRVHDDLVAIVALPAIGDASVYATKTPSGVTVVYAVEERPIIAEVRFDGIQALAKNDLPTGPMQEGKPFDGAAVKAFANALGDAYKARGFGGANVAVATDPAGEGRVRVRVTVTEGPKWTFGKIDFRGQSKAKESDLLSAAQLQTGTTFDEDVLERAALVLTAWYYDRGMVNAHVDAHVAKPGADGVVPITFTIQEGDVFSISTLEVEGVPAAEQKTLLGEVKAKPKQLFVRSTLVEDLQRVKARAAALHPRADVEVEPLTELDPKTKTIALRFKVTVHDH